MKISETIKKETVHIAIGVLLGDAVMLLVFALLRKLDLTVVLGAALGSVAAVLNFFVMGISVQRALDCPEKAKAMVQRSYTWRMLAMAGILVLAVKLPYFHPVAAAVPYLLPRITIYAMQLLGLYRPEEKGNGESA